MKILHIIVGLDIGGAENMLKRLIESIPNNVKKPIVISLTSVGVIGNSLRASGVTVYSLNMRSIFDFPIILWSLIKLIRRYKPSLVQTWMYHADLIGGLAAYLSGNCKIVWNVRSTAIPQGIFSATFWIVRLCALTSFFIPNRIVCNANSAKAAHIKLHYAANKLTVISNGYDFSEFAGSNLSRGVSRQEFQFDEHDIVIGVIGRFDPLKDFYNFVMAASYVAKKCGNAKFLMIGRGNDKSNIALGEWIKKANLENKFYLAGEQINVKYYLSAMDVFCLSSSHEAFPNVVVEAMAVGLPCVVTQAGDAADIVNDNNFVVPTNDPASLADKLLFLCKMNDEERKTIGEKNAYRVRAAYGIESAYQRYNLVYEEVLKNV